MTAPISRSYLCPTGTRRGGCAVFIHNSNWNGVLRTNGAARVLDPQESEDAASSVTSRDIQEVRRYADQLLRRGRGVTSLEIFEFVIAGIDAGRIDPCRAATPHARAHSLRRRFCDLCP